MLWESVFLLMILKIPVVYLCVVVWWAIRAVPEPLAGAGLLASLEPMSEGPACEWNQGRRRRPIRPLPRGGRDVRARRAVVGAR